MKTKIQCQNCCAALVADGKLLGKTATCPKCEQPTVITRPSAQLSERVQSSKPVRSNGARIGDDDDPLISRRVRTPDVRLNVAFAIAWVLLGTALAQLAPSLTLTFGPAEQLFHILPLLGTAAAIVWNLWVLIKIVGLTGRNRPALPITITMMLLFALFFLQISRHLGIEHYECERVPTLAEWLVFTVVHAFRAADVFDTLQAYGIEIQSIRPASHLSAIALIAFRIMVDLFFLKIIIDLVGRVKDRIKTMLSEHEWNDDLVRYGMMFGGLLFFAWMLNMCFHPWRAIDIVLWPLDNLLRVIDFPDAMHAYDWRLHRVPNSFWTSTLAFLFRIYIGILLADGLNKAKQRISLAWLDGFGMSRYDLESVLRGDPDDQLRARATQRLAEIEKIEDSVRQIRWASLNHIAVAFGMGCIGIVSLFLLAGHRDATKRLAQTAVGPNAAAAKRALGALRRLGPGAAPTSIPLFESELANLSMRRKLIVVDTLGYFGESGIDLLRRADDNKEVTLRAIEALRNIGPKSVPTLANALKASDIDIAQAAESAIIKIGMEAVQPLVDTIDRHNYSYRFPLIQRLDPSWHERNSRSPYFEEVLSTYRRFKLLRTQLSDDDSSVRKKAAIALHTTGPMATGAVPDLTRCLRDRDPGVRKAAAIALGGIGPAAESAVWALIKLLSDDDFEIRQMAAVALGRIGPGAALAVPALIERLRDDHLRVRVASSEALGRIGPSAKSAVPILIEGVTDKNSSVRNASSLALAQIGEPAIKPLVTLLADYDGEEYKYRGVSEVIAVAIEKIGPASGVTVELLIDSLPDADGQTREAAIRILDKVDPHWHKSTLAHDAVDPLIKWLGDDSISVRLYASKALGQIGPRSKDAVPALIKQLDDSSTYVQQAAIISLGKIGPAAEDAVPLLIKRLGHPSNFVSQSYDRRKMRDASRKALIQIGTPAVSQLADLVNDADVSLKGRIAAISALGEIGPAAEDALPALIKQLEGTQPNVREVTAKAIAQIERN